LQLRFVLTERLASSLAKNIQLCHIMFEQVRRHLWLLERVIDPNGGNMPVQDVPQLIHGLRVDFQRLLQKLDAQEFLRPLRRTEP
jgi:hypothetical protein